MKSKLPKGWKEIQFDESGLEIEDGDRGKNYPNKSQLLENGYCPFLNNKNILGDKLNLESIVFITKEKDQQLRKGKAYHGDIILTTRGSVGNVALVHEKVKYDFLRINSGMVIIRNKDSFNLEFLFQLLKSPYMKYQYQNMSTGSAQPQLPIRDIRKLKLIYPPLKEQEAIAKTLSSLDDKIELNNKINKNLEIQAQAVFKHWFVDFEFPDENGNPYKSSGGEMIETELGVIPKGWEIKSLDEIAEFLNGVAIAKFKPIIETDNSLPAMKIRELRQGFTDSSSDMCLKTVDKKYIIHDYDMIFSWSGSLLIDIWVGGEAILNQHLFKVTSKEYDQWYYYYWTKHFLEEFIQIARNKATTMGHINRSHLAEAKVLLPDQTTYKELGQVLNNMLKLKMKNEKQNKTLVQLRDTLLPKLMSGELRIPLD